MTEAQWLLQSTTLQAMLTYLQTEGSGRKLRLFAVACCRRIQHLLSESSLQQVTVAEKFADGLNGLCSEEELLAAYWGNPLAELPTGKFENAAIAAISAVYPDAFKAAFRTAFASQRAAYPELITEEGVEDGPERHAQANILRDIFGNPFQPVSVELTWRTSNVVAVAGSIYQEKAFNRLPILADALMDAGCEDEQIINHCRSGGPHVRGCWVVDLVLGRS
jgi:hypothetical protein